MLKDLRESSGYTIQRAAVATRIARPFIEALEDDQPQKLPASVFGRGFIRNLCKVYGADPTPILCAFDISAGTNTDSSVVPDENPLAASSKKRASLKQRKKLRQTLGFWRVGLTSALARKRTWIILGFGIFTVASVTSVFWLRSQKLPSQKQLGSLTGSNSHSQAGHLDESNKAAQESSDKSIPASAEVVVPSSKTSQEALIENQKSVGVSKPVVKPDSKLSAAAEPVVTVKVLKATEVEIDRNDGKGFQPLPLNPGTERIRFGKTLTMVLKDTSAVELSYAGKPLGDLSSLGLARRITFQAAR
jgi:cytoskeletal protein RodZ